MDQVWHEVLWKSIMERVHTNLPYKDFTMPSSVEQKTICTQTGMLATSSCPSLTEYFAKGSVPSQSCTGHYVESTEEPSSETKDENADKDKEKTDDIQNPDSGTSDGTTENPDTVIPPIDGGGDSGGDSSDGGETTPPDDSGGGDSSGGDAGDGGAELPSL